MQKKFLLGFFVLFKTSTDWIRPTHIREKNLLYLVYQFLIYPKTYRHTRIMFDQISGCPVTWSS